MALWTDPADEGLGIIRERHWLAFGDDGVGRSLPMPIKDATVAVWNALSCRLLGHWDVGLDFCPNCCRRMFPDNPTMEDWLAEVRGRR